MTSKELGQLLVVRVVVDRVDVTRRRVNMIRIVIINYISLGNRMRGRLIVFKDKLEEICN